MKTFPSTKLISCSIDLVPNVSPFPSFIRNLFVLLPKSSFSSIDPMEKLAGLTEGLEVKLAYPMDELISK